MTTICTPITMLSHTLPYFLLIYVYFQYPRVSLIVLCLKYTLHCISIRQTVSNLPRFIVTSMIMLKIMCQLLSQLKAELSHLRKFSWLT